MIRGKKIISDIFDSGVAPQVFHVLGAFDRFNYGDVLFAQVSKQLIMDEFPGAQIAFHGTHRSDLTEMGGVPTKPMRALYREIGRQTQPVRNVIVVAGGEVLGAPWHLMYEHAMSPMAARTLRRIRHRIGSERLDLVFKLLSRCPSVLPWIPDPVTFTTTGTVDVIYNSVGGQGVGLGYAEMTQWQRSSLAKASWLSVRDAKTADRIVALGLPKPRLSPDSAVLMAEMQSPLALRGHRSAVWGRMKSEGFVENGYLCVQCGMKYFDKNETVLVDQIQRVHAQYGLPIVGFAIGRAAGHEDHIVARRLAERLGHPSWFSLAPEDMTIWEIMSLIAGSACYVGSSLHGYITAFAFAKPRVGLASIGKIVGFRDAWDIPDMPAGPSFPEIAEAVGRALAQDRGAMRAQADQVARQYRADTVDMWSSLRH